MKKSLLLLNVIFALTNQAQSAIQTWAARYSNLVNSYDEGFRVVADNTSNVVVVALTDDGVTGRNLLLIKYSNTGVALWMNRYAGPGSGSSSQPNVVVDAGGNIFALTSSIGDNGFADLVTLKYSSLGTPLWTNRYNALGGGHAQTGGLALDGNGDVIVTGSSVGIGTSLDYTTIKYSSAGAPLWTNRYNGTGNGNDVANAVAVDTSGNVFVAGSSSSPTSYDFTTVAYSSAGAPLWVNRYHAAGNDDEAFAVTTAGGKVFVTGYTTAIIDGYPDYVTIAYSDAGLPLWTNRYNGPGNETDQAVAIAVFNTNVFVTGYSYSSTAFDDFATIAYSTVGMPLWTNRYNGPGNGTDRAQALAVDSSGNLYVTGYSDGSTSGSDYATIAYSSAGIVLWLTRYGGPGSGSDMAHGLGLDASGNVFVTGGSASGGAQDVVTIKYSNLGVASWTNSYNGVAGSDSSPQAVAVDRNGNIIVTGYSKGNDSGQDFATIKYSSTGVALWTNRYNGPANGDDKAYAVAVDSSGNVFVAGQTPGTGDWPDYLTIAYSSAGIPLWTNQYNGPGNYVDVANAVAVDSSGNVFVTGTSSVSSGGQSYATIKYSNAGVPLWTNFYFGPGNYDFPTAITVDGSGNVIITGNSGATASSTTFDYATVKYSNAGTALWTNRYNGPGNTEDDAYAVAVDKSGNVLVTGASTGSSGYDYATLKYSSAGLPVWTNRFNGPANGQDNAYSLAVDATGNAFVTGSSSSGSSIDYATIAYSSGGLPLWTNRYRAPGNDAEAYAVVVDAGGRVFVTGFSLSGASLDFATIAYSNEGLGLWTNIYNGPVKGDDLPLTPRSMALVGNGSVAVIGQSSGLYGGGRNDYATVVYATAPLLDIRRSAPNTLAVSWPSPFVGFHLQQNTNLLGTNWSAVGASPSDDGTNKMVLITPPVGTQFYRLIYP